MALGLAPAVLAEKLRGPRALVQVGDSLYGPPRQGSAVAWAAWVYVHPAQRRRGLGAAQLDALEARARADGATSLRLGGPPGNYCVPGLCDQVPGLAAALARRGYTPLSQSVDLVVDVGGCAPGERPALRDGDAHDLGWIASHFSPGWADECARALASGGVRVATDTAGAPLGFAAWGGNLTSLGRFGPVGVLPAARGRGLGATLSRVAFAALAAQGFARVTVPWVNAETVAFYAGLVPIVGRATHTLYARAL